jgi:hypothetical protein
MEKLISHKQCTKCGITKDVDQFYKASVPKSGVYRGDGYKSMCKECFVKRASFWNKSNPDRRLEISRKSAEKNRDKKNAYYASDVAKTKAEIWRKKNVVAYMKRRRETDPLYAFKWRTRQMLQKAFSRNGYTKSSKSSEILGCTWAEFMLHIERQFLPGMTWQNRSEWHIDHIIPLATAKTEEDVVKLNHHTNLRPMWAQDNLRKSAKLESLL